MTDSNPFSPDSWLDAQRKYWDAWMDMTRQTSSAVTQDQTPDNPWATALDQWWKAVSPMTSGTAPLLQDFYDKLIGMGKSSLVFIESDAFYELEVLKSSFFTRPALRTGPGRVMPSCFPAAG